MGELIGLGDAELVALTASGDEGAYGELVRRYRRAAFTLALSVTGRHEDAEDAAQDAFLVALDRIEECREPGRFGGWVLTIVRNRAHNLVRREVLRQGDALPHSLATSHPTPDRVAEQGALRERLTQALSTLTEVQREVVLLHDLEGWKHREIAERLEMPAGTVRSHLHYARKRLRDLLVRDVELVSEEQEG